MVRQASSLPNTREIIVYCGDPLWPEGKRTSVGSGLEMAQIIQKWNPETGQERFVFVLGPYSMGMIEQTTKDFRGIVEAICAKGLPESRGYIISFETYSNFRVRRRGVAFKGSMVGSNASAAFDIEEGAPLPRVDESTRPIYLAHMEKNLRAKGGAVDLEESLAYMTSRLSSGAVEMMIRFVTEAKRLTDTGMRVVEGVRDIGMEAAQRAAAIAGKAARDLATFLNTGSKPPGREP